MRKSKLRHSQKWLALLTLPFVCTAFPVWAATPPNSATALEGSKPPTVQQPVEKKSPVIFVEGQEPPAAENGGGKIPVHAFRFSGDLPVPQEELQSLVTGDTGKEITLNRLNELAGQITNHLRQKGYLVAFAYIPAQDIKDGAVTIAVVPGKYEEIQIKGSTTINPERIKNMLFAASPGSIITRESLERALLLLNDLSGLQASATLIPGKNAGSADLVVTVADGAKVSGAFYADNWGNRYTGENRIGITATINNTSNAGDSFRLGGLLTEGQRLDDYDFAYSALLGNDGARWSVSHSRVHYTLGEEFTAADYSGRSVTTSYSVSYPLKRSREFSLYGSAGYDVKHLKDDVAGNESPKNNGMWNLGLSGNFSDNWLGGGSNSFSLTHYRGKLDIETAATALYDASTAQAAGNFAKTVLDWHRQQAVAPNLNLAFHFTGQTANKNLDSSEKLFLGGADGVRAFPQGEASGDEGYLVSSELQWLLPGLSDSKNTVSLAGFYDYGSVIVNKHPWAEAGDNRRSLMGVGLGIRWNHNRDYAFRLDYAWKIGDEPATSGNDKSGRLWLQGIRYF